MTPTQDRTSDQLPADYADEELSLDLPVSSLTYKEADEILKYRLKIAREDPLRLMNYIVERSSFYVRKRRLEKRLTTAEVAADLGLPEAEILRAERYDLDAIPQTLGCLNLYYMEQNAEIWQPIARELAKKICIYLQEDAKFAEQRRIQEEKWQKRKLRTLSRRLRDYDKDTYFDPLYVFMKDLDPKPTSAKRASVKPAPAKSVAVKTAPVNPASVKRAQKQRS